MFDGGTFVNSDGKEYGQFIFGWWIFTGDDKVDEFEIEDTIWSPLFEEGRCWCWFVGLEALIFKNI